AAGGGAGDRQDSPLAGARPAGRPARLERAGERLPAPRRAGALCAAARCARAASADATAGPPARRLAGVRLAGPAVARVGGAPGAASRGDVAPAQERRLLYAA